MGDLVVSLDGVDFSECALEGSVTRRLNRPAQAQIKIPMDCAAGCSAPGERLKISFDAGNSIFFHGMVMDWELDAGEDDGYIVINAMDPMELWMHRPVRADDGDFSKPAGDGGANDLFATYIQGPQIIEAMLKNTEGDTTAQGNPALTTPAQREGPTFLTFGTFDTGGVPLTGAPVDWPMNIGELVNLFVSTGEVDVVITPTDPGGDIMGTVDVYNGDYGTDLSGSVVFEYGTGSLNARAVRWNQDMSNITNKLWYYGGPRVGTSADPAGDQHWCWNIQGDDPAFNPAGSSTGAWSSGVGYAADDVATNTVGGGTISFICYTAHTSAAANEPGVGADWALYWFVWMVPPGGRSSPPASSTDNDLGVCRIDSQDAYGVRMDIQIFDSLSENCAGGNGYDPGRDMYRKLWQAESWARCNPRTLIHITPTRGTEIGTFDIGDLVGVTIGSQICGGASGAQRVYQYTISWDEDGPFALSELQTSSDVGTP